MTQEYNFIIEDLVAANRILSREDVVDAYGHVSSRHPDNPQRFLLSRARAPAAIEAGDIMEFTLEGEAVDARGRSPYLERFIHGAIYEARPEIRSVVHNHSHNVIPFGITGTKLRPVMHTCAGIGHKVPIWDTQAKFGDTNMLVSDMAMGRDLARALGDRPTALMRGHGCVAVAESIREAVSIAVYLNVNAELQMKAAALGKITFLSKGEVDKVNGGKRPYVGVERAWEYWCLRAGVPYRKWES
ncbi:MAG TPA: class II aldolase/adducin family protein [Stellaceae bacterium]|jgi:HCOMODA/2-hydroxy-3-carboxy-muconic semialdehyde decarboxylase|nr:class II aldolase/adducin family protein [Stellaceae bacterium]